MDTRLLGGKVVFQVFLYVTSRMGSDSYHIYHLGEWPGPISETSTKLNHSLTNGQSYSHRKRNLSHHGPQSSVPLHCQRKTPASSCSGWGQAGEQSSCWGGDWEVAWTLLGAKRPRPKLAHQSKCCRLAQACSDQTL